MKQKVTVGFVMTVCQSVCKNLASAGWIFTAIFTGGGHLLKYVEKIKVFGKSGRQTLYMKT